MPNILQVALMSKRYTPVSSQLINCFLVKETIQVYILSLNYSRSSYQTAQSRYKQQFRLPLNDNNDNLSPKVKNVNYFYF